MDLFVYALTAGAFATLNPCGFSLLPASLGRFLAGRGRGPGAGLVVGLDMGAGALSAFAAIGAVLSLFGAAMGAYLPYLNGVLALALIVLGARTLLGSPPALILRGSQGAEGGTLEFYFFSAAYGLASLGCALPVFLAVVGAALAEGPKGTVLIMAYGLGMSVVLSGRGWLRALGSSERCGRSG